MRRPTTRGLVLIFLALLVGLTVHAQDNADEILSSLSDEVLAAEAGIVYLLHQVSHELAVSSIDGQDVGNHRKTERVRLLRLPGAQTGRIGWALPPGATKELVYARVIHADGTAADLKPDVHIPGLPTLETTPDGALRSLDYAGLLPGDILEYETIQDSLASAHVFWLDYPLNAFGVPVLRAEILVSVPDDQRLKWEVVGDSHVEVELSASGQRLHAVIEDIPSAGFDTWVLQLDSIADYPRLTISSAPSWQAVVDDVLDLPVIAAEQLLALEALAVGLSFGSGSTAETIHRIGSFASYGFAECIASSSCPDFTGEGEAWRECVADPGCDIQSAWLSTESLLVMLDAIGIEAHLALASTFSSRPFSLGPVPALSPLADRYLVAIFGNEGGFQFIDPELGILWEMTHSAYEGKDVWVLDGSSDGQGQIVHIGPLAADENTVHWDLQATMPSVCRLEVLGTITATGRSAYEWSQHFTQGDSDRETFVSLWPGERVMWSESRRHGTDSWVESIRVLSIEVGDPFVARIAYERDLAHFGCFVDLTYFPSIATDISRLASVSTYACEGSQALNAAYPMTWSSDIVVTPPNGCDLEVSASNELSHGPVHYDFANVWDGESLVLSRSLVIGSEIDETSCEGLSDIVTEIVADELGAWFRVLPSEETSTSGEGAGMVATPEVVFRQYIEALQIGDYLTCAALIHPDSVAPVLEIMDDVLPLPDDVLESVLGTSNSLEPGEFSDIELVALFLEATVGQESMIEAILADTDFSIVGVVYEGTDLAYIVYRAIANINGVSTSTAGTVTLRREEDVWQLVLSSDETPVTTIMKSML